MPPNRQIVIFDNSPLEEAKWIDQAASMAGITYVGNDPITEELGKDPKAREVMNRRPDEHLTLFKEVGPYFQKALETTLSAKKISSSKLGLHSVNWLEYGTKAECAILDLDPLLGQLELGRKQGMKEEDVKKYEQMFGTRMQDSAKKYLSPDRILLLPKGASDSQKAELAAAHIKKFVR